MLLITPLSYIRKHEKTFHMVNFSDGVAIYNDSINSDGDFCERVPLFWQFITSGSSSVG